MPAKGTQTSFELFNEVTQWTKSPKTVWRSAFLLIRHSKYSAMLSMMVDYIGRNKEFLIFCDHKKLGKA